jgi:signal transduction histidine kinase
LAGFFLCRTQRKGVEGEYTALIDAIRSLQSFYNDSQLDAERVLLREGIEFCRFVLLDEEPGGISGNREIGKDDYLSLTLSIVSNFERLNGFAKRVSYFRLLPDFLRRVTESSVSRDCIVNSFTEVAGFIPTLVDNRVAVTNSDLSALSQELQELVSFSNALLVLEEQARIAANLSAMARTTQMIAHDIRAPFSLLVGVLDVLSEMDSGDDPVAFSRSVLPEIRATAASVSHL